MNGRKKLNSTAVHEAGHAVIGRVLGLPCGHATIVADEDSSGHTLTAPPDEIREYWFDHDDKWRSQGTAIRARIMTFMAGAEAERVVLGKCKGGDGRDRYEIVTMAASIFETPLGDDWDRWEARLRRHTTALCRRHRATIERVAQALSERKTLSAQELDALVAR